MKKVTTTLLIVLLFAGCITTPINEENYSKFNRPMDPSWAWLSGIIPGLTQVLNEEYWEALAYFSAFALPAIYADTFMIEDAQGNYTIKEGHEITYSFLIGSSAAVLIWSYGDGIYSTRKRNICWNEITKKREDEIPLRGIKKRVDTYQLKIGMNKNEVLEIFPGPSNINRSVGKWGTHEQWVYRRSSDIGDEVYLYFENGVLTSWQD